MALEEAVPAIATRLRDALAADFAGLWLEHTPTFRMHVAAVGDYTAVVGAVVAGTDFAPLTVFEPATESLAALEASIAAGASSLGAPHATEIDIKHNRGVIYLAEADRGRADVKAATGRGVRVQYLRSLGGPSAEVYAGLALSSCSAGFTIRSGTNVTGVTTAAHCSNTQTFGGTTLPFQGAKSNTTDVQWHTTPGITDSPKIKLGSTTYRIVLGHLTYNDVYQGMTLCKYGTSTLYDCGEVVQTTFRPPWISPNSPYFGKIQNCSVDMSTPGDSGGPVFRNSSAVGLTSGFWNNPLECSTDQNVFGFLYPFATDALDIGVLIGG